MTLTIPPSAETTAARPVVRADLEGAVTVADFLAGAGTLTLPERR